MTAPPEPRPGSAGGPSSDAVAPPGRFLAGALPMAVAFLAAWSAWFILRTSFPGKDGRVFCLADDAMISMAYARNAWHGLGLNWARFGAPVEGFTHPLWLAVMGVANAVPLPPTRTSLLVQIASAVCLLANLGAVRRLWRRLAGAEPGS